MQNSLPPKRNIPSPSSIIDLSQSEDFPETETTQLKDAVPSQKMKINEKMENNLEKPKSIEDTGDDFDEKDLYLEPGEPIIEWETVEFEKKQRDKKWYILIFTGILGIIAYALFTNNLLMAIIFILSGVLLIMFENKTPRTIKLSISTEGILAHDQLFNFNALESFWIFYEPGGLKLLSLKSKKSYLPYIQLPLGDADPGEIHEILSEFLPEEEHLHSVIEKIEKFF